MHPVRLITWFLVMPQKMGTSARGNLFDARIRTQPNMVSPDVTLENTQEKSKQGLQYSIDRISLTRWESITSLIAPESDFIILVQHRPDVIAISTVTTPR